MITRIPIAVLALAAVAAAQSAGTGDLPHFHPTLPREVDDGASLELIQLGRALFFSNDLSGDRSLSCASCHRPDHGYADPRRFSLGIDATPTPRNAPALIDRAWGKAFMWDGRFSSLEDQVLDPIRNPKEMRLPIPEAVKRLAAAPLWRERFLTTLGQPPDAGGLARALAAFVRRLRIPSTPVDRFLDGDAGALTPSERRGLWIFESKGGCWRCHGGPHFSDESFHATGVGARDGRLAPGRAAVTGLPGDRGRFKTPTLRGVALSPPYMHDGSLTSLPEVVRFYARGGNRDAGVPLDPKLIAFELDAADEAALVSFLEALSRSDLSGKDGK